jgi:type IV pilus assembly protein PilY1
MNRRSVTVLRIAMLSLSVAVAGIAHAQVDLADRPLFSTTSVPGNLALALSVEWPTATTAAYPATVAYSSTNEYMGYFDPTKCYFYNYDSGVPASSYFSPTGNASSRRCSSSASAPRWSGNYLNWASMQTLDAFRWVLTGGYRSKDEASYTTLTKTYSARDHSSAANKSLSGTTNVQGATPFDGSWTLNTRIQNLGTRMYITKDGDLTTPASVTAYQQQSNGASGANAPSTTAVYELYINVRVCTGAATTGPWQDRCVQYGSNYKPEGLLQQYALKLRYSAFGYLNDDGALRDGGVMRARMNSIGPLVPQPGAPSTTNPTPEWRSTDGTMIVNPVLDDSSQTATDSGVAVPNSGVMNYLNKFGYSAQNYKGYDPVGEMYYAVTRYFRNKGNVAAYSSLAGAGSNMARWVDGFPVIQNWDDPIKYSCQKNFILGIGDIYTWNDKNLPGSTITGTAANAWGTPINPSEPAVMPTDDPIADVFSSTNMVGQLEGITSLATSLGRDASGYQRANSVFMAGLAYAMHTKDIRPDLTNARGMQTINTYWLDVLENPYESKNQYWLTAKYGGFKVPTGFDPDAGSNGTTTLTTASWSNDTTANPDKVGSDSRPENYFTAESPEKLKAGLEAAFAKIDSENDESSSTAFATISPKVSTLGAATYSAYYTPKGWTGEVLAKTLNFDAQGNPTETERWNAQTILDATAASSRKIVTRCTPTGSTVAFNSSGMTSCNSVLSGYANVPNVTSQSSANFIEFIRGVRSREKANGGAYRDRTSVLGDIVGSKANAVGAPSFPYLEQHNAGYGAFKLAQASRTPVVYVGANDGMMHAFDATIPGGAPCANCGIELFAYVPSFVHAALPNLGDPTTFSHRYYVDATPQVFDIDFFKTQGATATAPDWRSVLIGGLGKGGKGYYAIDVTNPSSWTSDSAVAGKVLWEFTDSRMGFSYGDPLVVKTRKYDWVVVFTSGYNNSDGRGYLFIVNPRTGELLETIATPSGETGPINMARASAYIENYGNYTTDAVYAGDLQGNVWRFDLYAATGAYPAPVKLAQLTTPVTVGVPSPQPVTIRPMLEVHPATGRRYVVVATGRLLADSDIASTDIQSLYVIADGNAPLGQFYTSATLPGSVTFPVQRSNLNLNTDVLTGIGSTPTSPMGWVMNFGAASNGIAERADVTMTADRGVIIVPVNLPNGQACTPEGEGRVFALSLADGRTVLETVTPPATPGGAITATPLVSFAAGGVIRDAAILGVGGTSRLYIGTASGQMRRADWNLSRVLNLKRLNWREVPTVN